MGAQQNADGVREMCTRAGLGDGARLVDIGCGPIGALAELAEIAGPTGSVVGVDSSAEAVNTAWAGTGTGQVRIQRGGVQLRRVQHVGHVSAIVVVGEQRALNILGAAPWARRNPAGSRQRIVWVEGLPPGGAKITQFLRGMAWSSLPLRGHLARARPRVTRWIRGIAGRGQLYAVHTPSIAAE